MKPNVIRIDRRFQGPPESGNGGYVCGALAQFVGGGAVVRLRVPPPLEVDLEVRSTEGRAALLAGEVLVAEARAEKLELDLLRPPSFEQAEQAARSYRGFRSHWFPSCFVCGPDREPGEGLRIFPGQVAGRDFVAAPWIPDSSLAGVMEDTRQAGRVAPEFIWAALDCPGAFAFAEPEQGAVLLGELHAELQGDVRVGERCVLVAWELAHEGRKHHTAVALFGDTGACRGAARTTWIEVAASG